MNAEEYLKLEFEVQPQLYRKYAAFLSKEEIANKIKTPETLKKMLFGVDDKSVLIKEEGFGYVSSGFGYESEITSSASLSVVLLSQKKSVKKNFPDILFSGFDANVLGEEMIVEWVASLNLTQKISDAHRKSNDYSELSIDDKMFVDTIYELRKVARQVILSKIEIKDDAFFINVEKEEMVIKLDRVQKYDKYKDKLSDTYRKAINALFFS